MDSKPDSLRSPTKMVQVKREPADDVGRTRSVRRKMSDVPVPGEEVIRIQVGEGLGTKQFVFKKDLLRQHCNCFTGSEVDFDKVAGMDRWSLHRGNTESFDIFLNFLEYGQIFSSQDGDNMYIAADKRYEDREWGRLFAAWQLGKNLQSWSFQDAISDAIYDKIVDSSSWPPTRYLGIYYDRTKADSGFRKLILDIAIWGWSPATLKDLESKELQRNFLRDIALAHQARFGTSPVDPFTTDPKCKYHEHVEAGKPCWTTMFSSFKFLEL